MAGVDRQLTGHATTALVCVGLLACGVLWMWVDFYYIQTTADIGAAFGFVLLMMSIFLVLLYCCVAILVRKTKGLPAFTKERGPSFFAMPAYEPEARAASQDPLDPANLLKDPPAGAQVTHHSRRRVVILADGSVVGELLGGKAQRFESFGAYRDFVGG